MKIASMTWPQILDQMKQCFLTGGAMHVTSVHAKLVLPVCCTYFIILNAGCILRKDYRRIFHDVFNLGALILVFNCFVFGIYYSEDVRNLISRLIPPLTGWQFGRTNFFNPFLWYDGAQRQRRADESSERKGRTRLLQPAFPECKLSARGPLSAPFSADRPSYAGAVQ